MKRLRNLNSLTLTKRSGILFVIVFLCIFSFSISHAQFSLGAFWKKISTGGGSLNNPSGLSATPSDFSVQLSWTSGGGSTTGFVVVWATGATAPATCNAGISERVATGITASPYTVTGLVEGTQYSFRVCATDGTSISSGVTVTSTTTSTSRYIFVTTGTYKGNAIPSCATLASAAGLPNAANYTTYLGYNANNPTLNAGGAKLPLKNRRPSGSGGPQIAIDTRFATNLLASISYTQADVSVTGNAWTGVSSGGYTSSNNCSNWTTGGGGTWGQYGTPTSTSQAAWYDTGYLACTNSHRVICFDATNGTVPPPQVSGLTFTATSATTGILNWTNPTSEVIENIHSIYDGTIDSLGNCTSGLQVGGYTYGLPSKTYTSLTPGATYCALVKARDEDSLESAGVKIGFTMPLSTILWVSNLAIDGLSATGFTIKADYTGDSDGDYSATLYYCNATLNASCDPQGSGTGYGSVSMTKSGAYITGTVTGLAPSTWNEYDLINVRIVATDPDGVNGSPLNGSLTLLNVVQPPSSWGNPKVRIKSTDGSGNYNYGITNDSDYFGRAMDVYGRIMVVGAQLDDNSLTTFPTGAEANDSASDSGAAYIIRDTSAGNDWSSYVIDAYLKEATPAANAIFGTAVAFDGTTMAISAPSQSPRNVAGKVYVYREASANNNWSDVTLKDTITDPKWLTGTYDAFGTALVVSGRNLFVGDYNDDGKDETPGSEVATLVPDSGAVSVYYDATGDGTGYPASTPDKKIKQRSDFNTLNVMSKINFGKSISYSDSTLVVGAPGAPGFSVAGKVIVYSCTVTATGLPCGPVINWAAATNTITPKVLTVSSPFQVPNLSMIEGFYGASVSIDDNTVVVGAPSDDSEFENSNTGAGYTQSGTAYVWTSTNGNADWSSINMVKKIKNRDATGAVVTSGGHNLGSSVYVKGTVIALGSPMESSYTFVQPRVTVFKDSDGDGDFTTGSINFHELIMAPYNWTSGQLDHFGSRVVLDNSSGHFNLVISAHLESSTSTALGTDTNPGSGTGYQSGSIFVYGP